MDMEHGAKANIVFSINIPVKDFNGNEFLNGDIDGEALISALTEFDDEDNIFNNARITLGLGGANNIVATNPSDEALKDITGLLYDWEAGSYYELIDPEIPDESNNRNYLVWVEYNTILDAEGWNDAELAP
jgi:hypothetical protein